MNSRAAPKKKSTSTNISTRATFQTSLVGSSDARATSQLVDSNKAVIDYDQLVAVIMFVHLWISYVLTYIHS